MPTNTEKLKNAMRNIRQDGWTNAYTGLGTSRDKMIYNEFAAGARLPDEQADILFSEDDVAARICKTMPEYALRKGLTVNISPGTDPESKRIEKDMADKLEKLKATKSIKDSLTWANVFGGSALLLGMDDGQKGTNLKNPLNENNIKSISHINVIDKRYLTPIKWYDNPLESKFGTPETYLITPYASSATAAVIETAGIYEVHESRLIISNGILTSIRRRQQNDGWEDSLLNRVQRILTSFGVAWDTLGHIITDAHQGVFKMQHLIDAVAADDQAVIQKRMEMIDMSRSVVRALVLDAETEDFTRQSFNWNGIEKPFELLMYRVSVAADQPVSVLFGRSPAGMNATGEHDERNFNNQVEAYQRDRVKPQFQRLVELIFKSKDGPTNGIVPENWEIDFPSLWTTTPKEEAEIKKYMSETDKNYIETKVLTPQEVGISRFGPDGYSMETTIDLENRPEPEPIPVPEPEPEPSPGFVD